jgi:hypothetical protein
VEADGNFVRVQLVEDPAIIAECRAKTRSKAVCLSVTAARTLILVSWQSSLSAKILTNAIPFAANAYAICPKE